MILDSVPSGNVGFWSAAAFPNIGDQNILAAALALGFSMAEHHKPKRRQRDTESVSDDAAAHSI